MPKRITPEETPEERKSREAVESIATNIVSLAKAVNALLNGQLKRRALVILLANSSSCSQDQVKRILEALERLETDWINK